jgi:hypothetical protein
VTGDSVPDPDRIRGKLPRAVLVIEEFRRTEAEFIQTRATDAKPDQAGGLLIAMKPVPESLCAIAGDALQDLRSALDHEVHRMAVAVKGKNWSGLGECAFPLYREEGPYEKARQDRIGALPDEVKEVIDRLQLFRDPRDPETENLELLNELARVDRHRLLHLAVMQVTQLDANVVPPEELTGKLIGEVTPATTHGVHVRMKMRLAFAEPPATSLPVGGTLAKLATTVKRVIERMREAEAATALG